MIEIVAVLLVLYLLTVAASWALIKLVFDDVPAKYAFIPVVNVILPFVELYRGRTGAYPRTTPVQEFDREQARQYRGPPPPWRPL